ncbi:ATP6V0A4 [Symbiodinium sp. KB8]|nr:ATP6V0A4 [Symbiodinium sp. KB8]
MGLLRSEQMKYGMLVLPVNEARRIVGQLGKDSNLQFEDDNARDMRRPYRKHIQRIDEMERIIRFLIQEISSLEGCQLIKNKVDEFLQTDDTYTLEAVEGELQSLYQNFLRFKENNVNLTNERNQAVEEAEVVAVAREMLTGSRPSPDYVTEEESFESSAKKPLLGGEEVAVGTGRLGYLAGVVPKTDEARFARALWRAARGNTFTQFTPISQSVKDPKTGQDVQKSVFVVYFQGAGGPMQQKVLKVCSAFGVNMYNWPASAELAKTRHAHLLSVVKEKDTALEGYQFFMKTEAKDLLAPPSQNPQANSKLEEWRLFCIKEKSIFNILNLCSGEIALRVNVWYPAAEEAGIKALLQKLNAGSSQGAFLTPDKNVKSAPPTYIRVNDYTEVWQDVIDTYGIPKYQEANPALLTVVTFPFIFGMMYGDVGHGILLFLAGIWLCMNAETFRFTQPSLFTARYMVVSLGFFAIFAGFMYNDFFSVGLQIFDSRYKDAGGGNFVPTFDVKNEGGPGPYPFGLDWAWHGASNELLYVNSLKMKLSVLFGVLQMTVGLVLRWSNAFYEKNMTDFLCECIPMMIFMLCFFGWMDCMILYKWVHPIDNPPSIINSLICMAMGQEDKFPLWPGSVELAQTLMGGEVRIITDDPIEVPIMLLPKPFVLLYQHNSKQEKGDNLVTIDEVLAERPRLRRRFKRDLASSRILGKVLAELTNTPDLYYPDEHAAFRKFGFDNPDADEEMPEWANEADSGAHKDSTSDAPEHEHRERVTWKKMKDRPGHHRRYQTRRQKREPGAERTSEPPMVPLVAGAVKPPTDMALSEIFIHQIIETIEFVLGTVSHTASYLRIWALSLAHQQLSLVFFQKTLTMGLTMSFPMNGIMIYLMFAAWFAITLAVLLGMDVLECFLHTLRLHWVEFQSKFYKAEGLKFAPYSIKKLVTPTGDGE